jgi:beta-galactosidase
VASIGLPERTRDASDDRFPPLMPGFPKLLHGGDCNPDQWLHQPEIIHKE